MSDETIAVGFVEDNGGTNKLIQAVNRLADAADKLVSAEGRAEKATDSQGRAARKAGADNDYLSKTMGGAASAASGFAGALGAITAGFGISKIIGYADTYTNLSNQLKLVTKDQTATNDAVSKSYQIAQQTYTAFDTTANVYGKVTNALKSMNKDTAAAEGITRTLAQAASLSGTGSEAASRGFYQLNQALDQGVLRGEDFNAVFENTPAVMRAIAEGLRVPIGALRQMAENGELTAARVVTALQNAAPKVGAAFAQITPTVDQAWTVVTNAVIRYIGQANTAGGFTGILANGMITLANNLNIVVPVLGAFVAALGILAVSTVGTMLFGLATSFLTLATNIGLAAVALGTTFMIPLGLLAVAVGAAYVVMNQLGISFTDLLAKIPGASTVMDFFGKATEKAKAVGDGLNKTFGDMVGATGKAAAGQSSLAKSTDVVKDRMKAWEEQKKKNQDELDKLMKSMSDTVRANDQLHDSILTTIAAANDAGRGFDVASNILMEQYSPAAARAAQRAATLADNMYGSGSAAAQAASEYRAAASAADDYADSASSAASAAGNFATMSERNFGSQNPYSSGSSGKTGGFSVNANESFALTWDGADITQRMKYDVGAQTGYRIGTEQYGTEVELLQLKERQKRLDLLKQRFPDLTGAQALGIEMNPDLWAQYMRRYDQSKLDAQKGNSLYGYAHGGDFRVGGNGGTDSQLVKFWASPNETVSIRTPAQRKTEEQDNEPRGRRGRGGVYIGNFSVVAKDTDSFRNTRRQTMRDTVRDISKAIG